MQQDVIEAIPNNTSEESRKATVSIRKMPLDVWRQGRKKAIDEELTMTQYIIGLIEQDISNE